MQPTQKSLSIIPFVKLLFGHLPMPLVHGSFFGRHFYSSGGMLYDVIQRLVLVVDFFSVLFYFFGHQSPFVKTSRPVFLLPNGMFVQQHQNDTTRVPSVHSTFLPSTVRFRQMYGLQSFKHHMYLFSLLDRFAAPRQPCAKGYRHFSVDQFFLAFLQQMFFSCNSFGMFQPLCAVIPNSFLVSMVKYHVQRTCTKYLL
jgi:hypothetical protein